MILDYFWQLFSHNLAVDLGTSTLRIFVAGKGVEVRESTVVARHRKTKEVIALGEAAKKMLGRTPALIESFRPLKHSVIADFDAAVALLEHFFHEVHHGGGLLPKIPKPKVIINTPLGITEVERRAVQDAALSAGAREAYLIEAPLAAAIGMGLQIEEPQGLLLADLGGGTSEIAVISLGGIVTERSLRLAGEEMDQAIINYIRLKHSLLLGEATAEEAKIELASAIPKEKEKHLVVRGRDLEKGLPKSVKISSNEILEAILPIVNKIVEAFWQIIEETPPELVADIVKRGIILCGGVAQLDGFDKLISQEIKMPVWVAENSQDVLVKGCAKLLDDPSLLKKIKVRGGLK